MKPLKGKLEIKPFGFSDYYWNIIVGGKCQLIATDCYATEKSATRSAKRFAARCNIELEINK